MSIRYRRCSAQENPHDASAGAPLSSLTDISSILLGKTVFSAGWEGEGGTHSFSIQLSDRSSVWFFGGPGQPRIVLVDAPS